MAQTPNEKRAAGGNGDAQIFADHFQNDEPGYQARRGAVIALSPAWVKSHSEPAEVAMRRTPSPELHETRTTVARATQVDQQTPTSQGNYQRRGPGTWVHVSVALTRAISRLAVDDE